MTAAAIATAARAHARFVGAAAQAGLQAEPGRAGADLVELLGDLSRLVSAAEACAARAAVELDALRRAEEAEAGVPAQRRGSGVAAEVGLARRESASRGRDLLGVGRALCTEMPHTMARLADGDLTPWRATLLVREAGCLERIDRERLDRDLCGAVETLEGKGDRAVQGEAKRWCAAEDPAAVVARRAQAESERRVTLRPAPDTMAYLTALLPVAEGVSVYKTLLDRVAQARAGGDGRSRGQVMADALVAAVTGQPDGAAPGVLVNLVMTDRALFHGDGEPALLPGFGPVPAATAREMVASAGESPAGAFVRRLYLAPRSGALVAMDSTRRAVPTGLADLIEVRDGGSCRMPWCDAPIRHRDHVVPVASGGETAEPNLQGLCEAHNYAKEAPGWRAPPVADSAMHSVDIRTPSGARYSSTAPPLPGGHRRKADLKRVRRRRSRPRGAPARFSRAERELARYLRLVA